LFQTGRYSGKQKLVSNRYRRQTDTADRKMKKKTSWMTTNWKKEDYYEYEQKTFNSIYGRTNVEIFKCDKGYALCIDRRLYNSLTCPTKKEMKEMLYESFVSTTK
jgi:hypothetical protein